jgi:hypothetical protein
MKAGRLPATLMLPVLGLALAARAQCCSSGCSSCSSRGCRCATCAAMMRRRAAVKACSMRKLSGGARARAGRGRLNIRRIF